KPRKENTSQPPRNTKKENQTNQTNRHNHHTSHFRPVDPRYRPRRNLPSRTSTRRGATVLHQRTPRSTDDQTRVPSTTSAQRGSLHDQRHTRNHRTLSSSSTRRPQ